MSDKNITIDFSWIGLVILIIFLILFFEGEPDLHDVLIEWFQK